MLAIDSLAADVAADRLARVRAMFRRAGARPPFILWRPEEKDLAGSPLATLARAWRASHEPGTLPRLEALGLGRLRSCAARLTVLKADRESAPQPARDDRPFTRHGLGAFPDAQGDEGLPWLDRFNDAVCRAVAMRREPVYTEWQPPRAPFAPQWDRLVLPLAGAGSDGADVLVGAVVRSSLRGLVDAMPDAVLVLDDAGVVRACNSGAEQMFAQPEAALCGRPLAEFVVGGAGEMPADQPAPAREAEARRGDGERFTVEMAVGGARHDPRRSRVAILRDVTERKAMEARVRRLALSDPLTGVANRIVLEDALAAGLTRARRFGARMGLLLLDLDRFKPVNDRYGHPVGDALLREFARRLQGAVRETDVVARIGGDEFAVLFNDLAGSDLRPLLARLLRRLRPPARVGGVTIPLAVSIGAAACPDDGASADLLMAHADQALYHAKGRHRHKAACWSELRGAVPRPAATAP